MKKIGKNTKLYLIGMIIGGITLGITTVIADTIINSTSVSYKTTTVKAALDELYDIADFKQEVKDMLYPVGSIYISVSNTNPSEIFGGTWVSFGEGRTLLGTGWNKANTRTDLGTQGAGKFHVDDSETMGGEYSHPLSIAEMPIHQHDIADNGDTNYMAIVSNSAGQVLRGSEIQMVDNKNMKATYLRTTYSGGNRAHNNIQPFISVHMWKRTA